MIANVIGNKHILLLSPWDLWLLDAACRRWFLPGPSKSYKRPVLGVVHLTNSSTRWSPSHITSPPIDFLPPIGAVAKRLIGPRLYRKHTTTTTTKLYQLLPGHHPVSFSQATSDYIWLHFTILLTLSRRLLPLPRNQESTIKKTKKARRRTSQL